MDAVTAYRSAVINQLNVGAMSGASSAACSITNQNFASATSLLDAVYVDQRNIGQIVASSGDITNASINDMNEAFVDTSNPSVTVLQDNLAIMAAPNGVIRDSAISTGNHLTLGENVSSASVTQTNMIILVAQDIINTPVTYSNIVDGNTANAAISQSTVQAYSFTLDGTTVMVNTNGAGV